MNLKVGDFVLLKTLEQLREIYPDDFMPHSLTPEMIPLLGQRHRIESIRPATSGMGCKYNIKICDWFWPETALVLKTQLGNSLD